jgi:hypothetical protein
MTVDMIATYAANRLCIEYAGPGHFKTVKKTNLLLQRKQELREHFSWECLIWPYWIQTCSKNVRVAFNLCQGGMASLWNTLTFFGDFLHPNSAKIIVDLTRRFDAIKDDGMGYMYLDGHTKKPVHPIVERIQDARVPRERLIPKGDTLGERFWLPQRLWRYAHSNQP